MTRSLQSSRPKVLLTAAFLTLLSSEARAHTTIKGLSDFSNGLVHPLFVPAHVLILLAIGFWTSRRRPFDPRSTLAAFAGSTAIGLILSATGVITHVPLPLLLAVAVAAAACVVSGREIPPKVRLPLTALAGLLLGMDSAPEPGQSGMAILKAAVGTWIGLHLWLMNAAYYTSLLPDRKWASYAVRILASWIIAIAVMVLALSLRPAP